MATDRARRRIRGFSLVELLVAMLFTGLLMAGMARVYQSSLSSFYTSGEVLSSFRRNRAATDMLYEDLNSASMYLTSLSAAPTDLSETNPPFYIIPNQPVAGAGADDPATADQIFFYMDLPLPFEGSYAPSGAGARSATEIIQAGGALLASDNSFTIECGDALYANQVKPGMSMIFKDQWETGYIVTATPSGSQVTVTLGQPASAQISGLGASGAPSKNKHITGSGILFYRPGQMVRYSVKMKNLDPQIPAGIPCLVRDQGIYSPAGFVADATQESVITENVSGFKVYLSVDSGKNGEGWGKTYAGFSSGWTNGLRADVNARLATVGRTDYKTTNGVLDWFRIVPTLVRVDLKTRTATKRTEYGSSPTAQAYQDMLQTVVIVPRHSGLPLS